MTCQHTAWLPRVRMPRWCCGLVSVVTGLWRGQHFESYMIQTHLICRPIWCLGEDSASGLAWFSRLAQSKFGSTLRTSALWSHERLLKDRTSGFQNGLLHVVAQNHHQTSSKGAVLIGMTRYDGIKISNHYKLYYNPPKISYKPPKMDDFRSQKPPENRKVHWYSDLLSAGEWVRRLPRTQ
jgi:hypothetical protein